MPDIVPKPGQAGPDAAPAPVSPQSPENPKASSPKVSKDPERRRRRRRPEKPASPHRPGNSCTGTEEPAPAGTRGAQFPAVTPPAKPETTTAAGVQTPPGKAMLSGRFMRRRYDPAELDTALKAAADNFGHPSTDITPAAYEKLRRVADVLTLVKRTSGGALPAEQQRAIHELLRGATATAARTDKIAQSAAALLASPDASGGILLTGTVTFVGVQEKLHGRGRADRRPGQAGERAQRPVALGQQGRQGADSRPPGARAGQEPGGLQGDAAAGGMGHFGRQTAVGSRWVAPARRENALAFLARNRG